MRLTAINGRVSVAVDLARWVNDDGQVRGVFDVYVKDDGRVVWTTDDLSVPANGETGRRALRDAVGFLVAYATGEYDGDVVPELAPYAAELEELSADLDEREDA